MKAFLVNRVGDFGFILGIGLLVAYAGTLNYAETFAKAPELAKLTFPGRRLDADHGGLHLPVHRRDGQERAVSRCTCGCPTRWKARRPSRR
jgi:hypothetical protein